MEFESTIMCMQDIINNMCTLGVDQLKWFFRNANDAFNLDYYIQTLISSPLYDFNKVKNRISYHLAPKYKDNVIDRYILAFWVVAYFGYEAVREVQLLKYPSQILFITEDDDEFQEGESKNEVYDVTVCTTEMEASVAYQNRQLYAIDGVKDEVNHIAMVTNHDIGKAVMKYGFDCYCMLDADKIPQWYQ